MKLQLEVTFLVTALLFSLITVKKLHFFDNEFYSYFYRYFAHYWTQAIYTVKKNFYTYNRCKIDYMISPVHIKNHAILQKLCKFTKIM